MALALLIALAATGAREAAAQGSRVLVLVPFDLTQGAMTSTAGITPYVGSAKAQVAFGFGRGGPIRVGPVVAVRYANPDWTVAAGARLQWLPVRFGLGGRRWGFGVAAEQLWDTPAYVPGSLSLVADLELLRLSGGVVYEWETERTGFELGLGTDLRSLHAVLFPGRDEDPFGDTP